jgi:O-acetylhomoserine/O-acetylserine sulfhydrylase-like pyridoxal-dependent enzyme
MSEQLRPETLALHAGQSPDSATNVLAVPSAYRSESSTSTTSSKTSTKR